MADCVGAASTGLVLGCAACAAGVVTVPSFPEHDTPGLNDRPLHSGALAAASPFTVRRVDKECHILAKTTAYQIRQTSVPAESFRQTRTNHPSKRGKQQVSFPMTPLMMTTTRLPSTGAHVLTSPHNVPTHTPPADRDRNKENIPGSLVQRSSPQH